MSQMRKLLIVSILIFTVSVILSITPMIGDRMEQAKAGYGEVESITVFILDEGTTATTVKCGIYDANTNRLLRVTEEQLITTDAWNVCEFENNIDVKPGQDYILVAFANGDIAIPADGTNYVTDSGNTYDTFPTTIDYAGTETSMLSIYAIYA